MAYKNIKRISTAEEIIQRMPLSKNGHAMVARHREEIAAIIANQDDRLLMILGPCSAWPHDATLEYAKRLYKLSKEVESQLKIIMRVYIQKPRTVKGWSGPINQPDPLLKADIEEGINYARKLMVEITEMGLAIADEALFTHNAKGFSELLSWVAIGARSSEDQEHRIHASSLDCPVGIKNPTHGSIKIGVNGVIAAQHPHVAVFDGYVIETDGNPYAHLVLRGGNNEPNYKIESLIEAKQFLAAGKVKNPAIIVDASHDNCIVNGVKDFEFQDKIVLDVVESLKSNPELKKLVKGFMLESFIKSGKQNVETASSIDLGGLSITDPCISWEKTEILLHKLADIHGQGAKNSD